MKRIPGNIFFLLVVFSSIVIQAQHVAVFCGGEMYQNIEQNAGTLKMSGFNTIIFWSVHIHPDGTLILNDSKIIEDGEYVGHEIWLTEIALLKKQPSSVNRIEFSVGAWSVPDFENIESLIDSEGTGESSILYKNFKKLKEITGADAIDFDDESNYDVSSTVAFSEMLVQLGYKITLCPYTQKSFWQSVYNQVRAKHPNAIDRIYLQCYAGGASNTPAAWNDLFEGLKVSPGLWCSHGEGCMSGLDWRGVKHKLNSWRSGIEGGFMWSFDGILSCSMGGTPEDYAKAIRDVMGIQAVAPGKAYNSEPSDSAVEVSVDQNLRWIAGSYDATHKIYLGTDSLLNESSFLGTTRQAEFEPGTLSNDSTYFWCVDEFNDAGTVRGDLWRFTTEEVTLPAEKSSAPDPTDGDDNPSIWSSLRWRAGKGTVKHQVYFGMTNPPPFVGEQSDTLYKPGRLLTKTAYFWRIDEVNSAGVTIGDVWSFSILSGNIAPEAVVEVSSEYGDPNWSKEKLTDGIVKINGRGEWASDFETYPWIKLTWNESRTIHSVSLYDRPHPSVAIYAGTLTFSDDTSIEVGELPNNGDPLKVNFAAKQVNWMKFQVDNSPGSTTGLAEIEVYESRFPVGVSQHDDNKFSVYPNPATNGIFYLNIPSEGLFQLHIYTVSGELIKSLGQYEDKAMIDIHDMPHGLYALKISNKDEIFTSQVLH